MGYNQAASFKGNRITRKNSSCDKLSYSGFGRSASFEKKNGAGKGNWGRLGDEGDDYMDAADPAYDPIEIETELALFEHESSR
mmetsp:Transcript_15019/g.10506  ORF Transcript_15019/g.10506 Transcript_15019/m.10506 type:complete len:83 (+) Transcript_15019:56-304(+)